MNLLVALDKGSLSDILRDIRSIHSASQKDDQSKSLTTIKLEEFLVVMTKQITNDDHRMNDLYQYFSSKEGLSLSFLLCSVFDLIDVDSRGLISWNDFTNFCLRIGRLTFKPSVKRSISNFKQENYPGANYKFPVFKMAFVSATNTLFAFDSATPNLRLYGKNGRYLGKVNPVLELKKAMKFNYATHTQTYASRKQHDKELQKAKQAEKDLNPLKGRILALCYIETTKQYAVTTSGNYVAFLDFATTVKEGLTCKIISSVRAQFPQVGLYYSKLLNLLLSWSGEGSEYIIKVWDPVSRKLRLRIQKHHHLITSLCDVTLTKEHPLMSHYIVSSSIDGKVIMWPSAPMSVLTGKLSGKKQTVPEQQFEFKGHKHAIRQLLFASEHEVLIGAGFDFEILIWDLWTKDVIMRLVGHYKSLFSIQLIYTPNEKVVSIDEGGTIKVWNIDKELGLFGSVLQTIQLQIEELPIQLTDFCAAFNNGSTIAVLEKKLYFLSMEGENTSGLRPVPRGLGICQTSCQAYAISPSTINVVGLADGVIVKRLPFLDQDRISSADVIRTALVAAHEAHEKHDHQKEAAAAATASHHGIPSSGAAVPVSASSAKGTPKIIAGGGMNRGDGLGGVLKAHGSHEQFVSYIGERDTVTAVATDTCGKKIFLGTNDGRIFIFDGYTFGLLLQLTDEARDNYFLQQGSVAGLQYCQRDELVMAVYSNGAIKVFVGCHRTRDISESMLQQSAAGGASTAATSAAAATEYPGGNGGKSPAHPFLLRECDLSVVTDGSMCALAFSEDYNVLAALSKEGLIVVYDYVTLELLAALHVPKFEGQHVPCLDITFTPGAPLLVVTDGVGRVTLFTVRPMTFQWLHTYSVYHQIGYAATNNVNPAAAATAAMDPVSTSLLPQPSHYGWSSVKHGQPIPPEGQTIIPLQGFALQCCAAFHWIATDDELMAEGLSDEQIAAHKGMRGKKDVGPAAIASVAAAFGQSARASTDGAKRETKRRMPTRISMQPPPHVVSPMERWCVVVGDEMGNIMIHDLTRLVHYCGACDSDCGPSKGAVAAYQQSRPFRVNTLSGGAARVLRVRAAAAAAAAAAVQDYDFDHSNRTPVDNMMAGGLAAPTSIEAGLGGPSSPSGTGDIPNAVVEESFRGEAAINHMLTHPIGLNMTVPPFFLAGGHNKSSVHNDDSATASLEGDSITFGKGSLEGSLEGSQVLSVPEVMAASKPREGATSSLNGTGTVGIAVNPKAMSPALAASLVLGVRKWIAYKGEAVSALCVTYGSGVQHPPPNLISELDENPYFSASPNKKGQVPSTSAAAAVPATPVNSNLTSSNGNLRHKPTVLYSVSELGHIRMWDFHEGLYYGQARELSEDAKLGVKSRFGSADTSGGGGRGRGGIDEDEGVVWGEADDAKIEGRGGEGGAGAGGGSTGGTGTAGMSTNITYVTSVITDVAVTDNGTTVKSRRLSVLPAAVSKSSVSSLLSKSGSNASSMLGSPTPVRLTVEDQSGQQQLPSSFISPSPTKKNAKHVSMRLDSDAASGAGGTFQLTATAAAGGGGGSFVDDNDTNWTPSYRPSSKAQQLLPNALYSTSETLKRAKAQSSLPSTAYRHKAIGWKNPLSISSLTTATTGTAFGVANQRLLSRIGDEYSSVMTQFTSHKFTYFQRLCNWIMERMLQLRHEAEEDQSLLRQHQIHGFNSAHHNDHGHKNGSLLAAAERMHQQHVNERHKEEMDRIHHTFDVNNDNRRGSLQRSTSYQKKFQSSENILKTLNSFFVKKEKDETPAPIAIKSSSGTSAASRRESIMGKSSSPSAQRKTLFDDEDDEDLAGPNVNDPEPDYILKLKKTNMHGMISHIQNTAAFHSVVKTNTDSKAFVFRNMEAEKERNRHKKQSADQMEDIENMVATAAVRNPGYKPASVTDLQVAEAPICGHNSKEGNSDDFAVDDSGTATAPTDEEGKSGASVAAVIDATASCVGAATGQGADQPSRVVHAVGSVQSQNQLLLNETATRGPRVRPQSAPATQQKGVQKNRNTSNDQLTEHNSALHPVSPPPHLLDTASMESMQKDRDDIILRMSRDHKQATSPTTKAAKSRKSNNSFAFNDLETDIAGDDGGGAAAGFSATARPPPSAVLSLQHPNSVTNSSDKGRPGSASGVVSITGISSTSKGHNAGIRGKSKAAATAVRARPSSASAASSRRRLPSASAAVSMSATYSAGALSNSLNTSSFSKSHQKIDSILHAIETMDDDDDANSNNDDDNNECENNDYEAENGMNNSRLSIGSGGRGTGTGGSGTGLLANNDNKMFLNRSAPAISNNSVISNGSITDGPSTFESNFSPVHKLGKEDFKGILQKRFSDNGIVDQSNHSNVIEDNATALATGSAPPSMHNNARLQAISKRLEEIVGVSDQKDIRRNDYNPAKANRVRELKKIAKQRAQEELQDRIKGRQFKGVSDVVHESHLLEMKAQYKNLSAGEVASSGGQYGPYTTNDLITYTNLVRSLTIVPNMEFFPKSATTSMMGGQVVVIPGREASSGTPVPKMEYFECVTKALTVKHDEYGYTVAELLRHPDVTAHPTYFTSIKNYAHRLQVDVISEPDLLRITFPYAQDSERTKMLLFVICIRLIHALMAATIPHTSVIDAAAATTAAATTAAVGGEAKARTGISKAVLVPSSSSSSSSSSNNNNKNSSKRVSVVSVASGASSPFSPTAAAAAGGRRRAPSATSGTITDEGNSDSEETDNDESRCDSGGAYNAFGAAANNENSQHQHGRSGKKGLSGSAFSSVGLKSALKVDPGGGGFGSPGGTAIATVTGSGGGGGGGAAVMGAAGDRRASFAATVMGGRGVDGKGGMGGNASSSRRQSVAMSVQSEFTGAEESGTGYDSRRQSIMTIDGEYDASSPVDPQFNSSRRAISLPASRRTSAAASPLWDGGAGSPSQQQQQRRSSSTSPTRGSHSPTKGGEEGEGEGGSRSTSPTFFGGRDSVGAVSAAEEKAARRAENIYNKYVVRPHPARGFRNWRLAKRMFTKMAMLLEHWYDLNHGSVQVVEFVEMFRSLVPKEDVSKFRILRKLDVLICRVGYKMSTEVNQEVFDKIFEYVLEIKLDKR